LCLYQAKAWIPFIICRVFPTRHHAKQIFNGYYSLEGIVSVSNQQGIFTMRSLLNLFLTTIFFLSTLTTSDAANSRVALIIGNSDYTAMNRLKNPVHDATDMAAVLRGLGFKVILKTDQNTTGMKRAVRQFRRELHDGGVGLFYFAGHGFQYNNLNYLAPIRASLYQIERKSLQANEILKNMEADNPNGLNIMILDACRNDISLPTSRSIFGNPVVGRGFAPMPLVPRGSFIAYATAANSLAMDGERERNSPFAKNLMKMLKDSPHLTLDELFQHVGTQVRQETKGTQVPWNYSSLTKRFCFADCGRQPIFDPETLYQKGIEAYDTRKYYQARKWYKQAAKQGHREAQYELGLMYQTGRGVRMNNRTACYWFRQSAAQGNRQAIDAKRSCSR
jgi:hypothetical protein